MRKLRMINIRIYVFGLLSSLMLVLSACGGGGEVGIGSGSSSVTYSGLTSQAVVTNANADDMSIGSYQNGTVSQSSGGIAALTLDTDGSSKPRGIIVADAIEHALTQVDIPSHANTSTVIAAVKTGSGSINGTGTCVGSFSYSITYDDVSGDFNGSGTFSDYCTADDSILNGSITFTGVINTSTLVFKQINLSTDGLSTQACGETFTVAGTFSLTVSSGNRTITMNMRVRDGSSGLVYWVNNLQMSLTIGATYVDISMTGRYYHPDYGYVNISTSTPLHVINGEVWPSSGVLLAEGNIGIASGVTKAKLTASGATYTFEADTNGDGSYDYTSPIKNWSTDLCSI